ncbi:uncharacterized protein IL334_004093 [Kwoniella shivajii]|uniref:Glycoside hydrolase family 5 domain-containing protein n=1 Tax=Kwoniella shivajii TaxID=564305 RepID=A0ABZ1D0N2_9TREE|nr:hypothetical protein IL334_004093 [Kwoniella shivajii]
MVAPNPSRSQLDTSHSYFLQPSSTTGGPPIGLLLRGVNISSTSKYPTLPQSLDEYQDLAGRTRDERDKKRRILAGQESYLGEEEVGFYSEAEQGGRDGWFVGRPFPLEEADVHLKRLKAWGFTTIRYLVTWEAIEHAGPGKYDEEFIDYTIKILHKCREHGMRVFISPHQDVFSRFTCGSGAPYWVLVALGLNPRRIHGTGSAIVHQCWSKGGFGGEEGIQGVLDDKLDDWPDMIWNTNLHRLAVRHCFTMFWSSERFAPKCKIDGIPASQYLQDHFISAYGHLAERISDAGDILDDCLIGWDSMNEPSEGFIGMPNLNEFPPAQSFKKGPSPTPLQGFQLGLGQKVNNIEFGDFTSTGQKSKGTVTITPPEGKGVWLTREEAKEAEMKWGWKWSEDWDFWDENGQGGCVWAAHGVWDPLKGTIKRPQYFSPPDSEVDFIRDFWRVHYTRFLERIRSSHPNAISFINPPVFEEPPDLSEDVKRGRIASSPHFYDGLTLLNKRRHVFNADAVGLQRGLTNILSALRFGSKSIRSTLRGQLGELKSDANKEEGMGNDVEGGEYPTIIGEIGTPWDMKETRLLGLAKGKTDRKDYKEPAKAMDEVLNACDGHNALSYTLWVYEPLSSHNLGDGWNGEDLSLISYDEIPTTSNSPEIDDDLLILKPPDLKSLITLGSRGIQSWCRPYPLESVSRIDKFSFEMKSSEFHLTILIQGVQNHKLWKKDSDSNENTLVNGNGVESEPTSSIDQNENDDVQGYTKVYLPYIHYLKSNLDLDSHSSTTTSSSTISSTSKSTPISTLVSSKGDQNPRLIGEPSEDEEEWIKGTEPARIDIELIELSEGSLEIKGQWGYWKYKLGEKGERIASLKIRPWKG